MAGLGGARATYIDKLRGAAAYAARAGALQVPGLRIQTDLFHTHRDAAHVRLWDRRFDRLQKSAG